MNKVLLDLGTSGSGCGSIRLASDSVALLLEYEYRQGDQDLVGRIRFARCWAHRFQDEMHCLEVPEGAYDVVVEVANSTWLAQHFDTRGGTRIRENRGERHMAVFLSNNGLLEVMARDVAREDPQKHFAIQI